MPRPFPTPDHLARSRAARRANHARELIRREMALLHHWVALIDSGVRPSIPRVARRLGWSQTTTKRTYRVVKAAGRLPGCPGSTPKSGGPKARLPKSSEAREWVLAAHRQLEAAGEPITNAAVAKRAGVSLRCAGKHLAKLRRERAIPPKGRTKFPDRP